MFRQVHLDAEQSRALRDVSTTVIPFKGEESDYADEDVTLSLSLNAELRNPADAEKKAIGMSLLLRHTGGCWIVEAETGWTGRTIGWDPFDSRKAQVATFDDLIKSAPPLVEWMGKRFRAEMAKLA